MKNIQFKGHTLSLKKEAKIKIGEKPAKDIVLWFMIVILSLIIVGNTNVSFEEIFLCFATTYLSAILLIGISVGITFLYGK